jgi:hypothetical protein
MESEIEGEKEKQRRKREDGRNFRRSWFFTLAAMVASSKRGTSRETRTARALRDASTLPESAERKREKEGRGERRRKGKLYFFGGKNKKQHGTHNSNFRAHLTRDDRFSFLSIGGVAWNA